MSLYSNILSYKRNDDKSDSDKPANASMKLLQDHLLAKQRSKQMLTPKQVQTKVKDLQKSAQVVSETCLHKPGENDWDPDEEYDPMVPNSYELLQAQYLKMREQEIQNRSNSLMGKLAVPDMLEILDKLESDETSEQEEQPSNTKKTKGTAIAPPPSLGSIYSSASNSNVQPIEPTVKAPPPNYEKLDGSSIAAKIMSKMGYKAGQGLGKDEQGISKPLEVEKSGTNMGKILPAPDKDAASFPTTVDDKKSLKGSTCDEFSSEATRVLLLQNMVGPGEVDDDLESETKEECKKYGSVIRCVIYEIPNKKVADEQAVRIFVEFRHTDSAIKAMKDLNGKYFGGRIVQASFYDVNKFNKFDLGPS